MRVKYFPKWRDFCLHVLSSSKLSTNQVLVILRSCMDVFSNLPRGSELIPTTLSVVTDCLSKHKELIQTKQPILLDSIMPGLTRALVPQFHTLGKVCTLMWMFLNVKLP